MKSHARHKHGTRLSGYGETIQVFIPPTCDFLFIHLDFLVERILFIWFLPKRRLTEKQWKNIWKRYVSKFGRWRLWHFHLDQVRNIMCCNVFKAFEWGPKMSERKCCPRSVPEVSQKCFRSVQKVYHKCPRSVPEVSPKCAGTRRRTRRSTTWTRNTTSLLLRNLKGFQSSCSLHKNKYATAAVAQLAARRSHNPKVGSSILSCRICNVLKTALNSLKTARCVASSLSGAAGLLKRVFSKSRPPRSLHCISSKRETFLREFDQYCAARCLRTNFTGRNWGAWT